MLASLLLMAASPAAAQGGAIGAFALAACSLRRVPATQFVPAYDELVVETASQPFLIKPCADADLYRGMALNFRKSARGDDESMLEPLSGDVRRLEPTRCGSLEGAPSDKYDFALAEYRLPGIDDLDRFVQIVRTDKRRAKRRMMYFRRYPGEIDSRMAVRALCDFDRDGFPDVVLDVCGKGGCGASVLQLKPKTGAVEYRVITAPAEQP